MKAILVLAILPFCVFAQQANTVVVLQTGEEYQAPVYLVQMNGYSNVLPDSLLATGGHSGNQWIFRAALGSATIAAIRTESRFIMGDMFLLPGDTLVISEVDDNMTFSGSGARWAQLAIRLAEYWRDFGERGFDSEGSPVTADRADSIMSIRMSRIGRTLDSAGAPESLRRLLEAPCYINWALARLNELMNRRLWDTPTHLPPLDVLLYFMKKIPDSMFQPPYARLMEPVCRRLLDVHFAEARFRLGNEANDMELLESVLDRITNVYTGHKRCMVYLALVRGLARERVSVDPALVRSLESMQARCPSPGAADAARQFMEGATR